MVRSRLTMLVGADVVMTGARASSIDFAGDAAVADLQNCTAVTVGSVIISDSAMVATTYRTSAAPLRRTASAMAVNTPTNVPCHRK